MNNILHNAASSSQGLSPAKEINELIYLVDEDRVFTENLVSDISSAGFNIQSFDNLDEFTIACKEQKPTIIISGMEFNGNPNAGTQQISKLNVLATKTSVFIISKGDDLATRLSATRAGCSRFFSRPVSNSDIINALFAIVNNKEEPKLRVLMVDDDEEVLSYHKAILDQENFSIQTEHEPMKLFSTLKDFDPEVLVLDNYMPGCSGFELAQIIRQNYKYSDLPIVFLSAEPQHNKQLEGMDIGADDFLIKPVETGYFNRLIYARAARTRKIKNLENERKVKSREANYLKIAMDQHSIVSATDATGKIILANEKFCEISGFSQYELLGKTHAMVNSGYHDAAYFKAMWAQISRGEVWHGEVCNRSKNGEIYWVKSTIVPFLDEQRLPYQYISIRTDITQIKASEELARKKELLVNKHHSAILKLVKDDTLTTKGLEASLQIIFKITAELMHAQRVSIWEFNKETTHLICKSSYTTSDSGPFITEQLNIKYYPHFISCFENQILLNTPDAQNNTHTAELLSTYLKPCNIYSKIDIALYSGGQFNGVLFIETTNKPFNWSVEYEDFAKAISEIISRRKLRAKSIQAQKELAISESRLRRSQEQANIGTWDWDIKTGKLVWSDRVAFLFGYESAIPEATYHNFYSIIHPDDRTLVINSIKECIKGKDEYNLEHRIVTQKGETRWLATQGSVNRDKNGQPLNMLCLVQDIHNRKMLEQNVRRQKSLLDTIRIAITEFVDSSQTKNIAKTLLPDLLKLTGSECGFIGAIHHQDKKPIMLTQALSSIKWNEGEHKAYDINKIGGPVFSQLNELIDITIHQGEVVICNDLKRDSRINLNTGDNSKIPDSYLGIPIIYGDETIGMFGLANRPQGYDEDVIQFLRPFTLTYGVIIHAQKMAVKELEQRDAIIQSREAAEKANQAKSLFLSNMSHELRTPLNAILGFTQLLLIKDQNNPLNDIQSESIKEISVAGEHLLTLISDILDLSKIETGISDLDIENFSLDSLFKECQGMLAPLANSSNIQLNFELQGLKLRTDRQRLKQILLNLISNAIKYNKPNGKVHITSDLTSPDKVKIAVEDTGVGIPQELQENLFQSFQRLGAEKTNIQGTGIGLVIAKSMTEYLSGNLSFESTEDQGSRFWIEIPNELNSNAESSSVNNLKSEKNLSASTALIIESDINQLEALNKLFLKENQFNLLHVDSIEKSYIVLAEQSNIGLIVIDIDANPIESASFCSLLKQNPSTTDATVIAVGKETSDDKEATIVAQGYSAYLPKPINDDLFFSSIKANSLTK